MYEHFTDRARKVMQLASQEAQRFNHESISTEHILLALIREGSGVAVNVLTNLDVDIRKIRIEVEKLIQSGHEMASVEKLAQTPRAKKVVEYAMEEARNLNHNFVGTEHLLLGLLREVGGVASHVLTNCGCRLEEIRQQILSLPNHGTEPEGEPVEAPQGGDKIGTPALDAFTADLTEQARQGRLRPVIGREAHIQRVMTVLARRDRGNPVLIGEPGSGRTAIVHALAMLTKQAATREPMYDWRILELDTAMIVAGTKYRGQFEERLKAMANEMRRAKNIILFVSDLHTLVQVASHPTGGGMTAFDVLKFGLSRGEFQCIGTTTPENYRKHVAIDRELERHFQPVVLEPPTARETLNILKGLREIYQDYHGVKISDEALEAAVELGNLYIPHRASPDKAINLVDDAGARLRLRSTSIPPEVLEIQTSIEKWNRQKRESVADQDSKQAAGCRDKVDELKRKLESVSWEWREESRAVWPVLNAESIIEAVNSLTGIPAEDIRERRSVTVPQNGEPVHSGVPIFERLQCESILHGHEVEIAPGLGLVLMPHDEAGESLELFEAAIRPAMAENSIRAELAGDIHQPGSRLNQVWECLRRAEVIVADLSGDHPSVMYELGLCFGLRRLPIILVRDTRELPSNLRALRPIEYQSSAAGTSVLKANLSAAICAFLAASRASPNHSPLNRQTAAAADAGAALNHSQTENLDQGRIAVSTIEPPEAESKTPESDEA